MILGDFQFSLKTMTANSISRTTDYNWAESERIGNLPNVQNLGMSSDKIELEGVFYPNFNKRNNYFNVSENRAINNVVNFISQQFGGSLVNDTGYSSIDDIRNSNLCKQANNLINDNGEIIGKFVINSIRETQSFFDKNGKAQKVEFSLSLTRVVSETENLSFITDEKTSVAEIATKIARSYLKW